MTRGGGGTADKKEGGGRTYPDTQLLRSLVGDECEVAQKSYCAKTVTLGHQPELAASRDIAKPPRNSQHELGRRMDRSREIN